MSVDRLTRVNELLRREIGEALFRVMRERDFDVGAVTVTHVVVSRNLRHARVLVSIREHESERPRMLNTLRKHRAEIQDHINKDLVLKYTPRLAFQLDTSLERGDHVLDILEELARASEPDDGADEPFESKSEERSES